MSMTESAATMALQGAGEQMAPTVGANEAAKPDASAGTEATADAAETQPMGSAQVEAEGETEDVDAVGCMSFVGAFIRARLDH